MNTNREINSVLKAQAAARRNAPRYEGRVTAESLAAAAARRAARAAR